MLITVGAFDGFHKGHRKLLNTCRENAVGDDWGVVTFYPHPSVFMGRMTHTLFTLQERELIRLFLGIPGMFVFKFDDTLMNLSPQEFWDILTVKLNADGLVTGSDFRFGRKRSGNVQTLEGISRIYTLPMLGRPRYSSSNVRKNILSGQISQANEILGYPFFIMSRVIHGNERGRTMNFPTANLEIHNGKVIPPYGVYACNVIADGRAYCGALSVGNNPTFGGISETRAEVHILDFSGDIYDSEITVMILDRLRGLQTFGNANELAVQIRNDIERCRAVYGEMMRGEALEFSRRVKEIYRKHKNFNVKVMDILQRD